MEIADVPGDRAAELAARAWGIVGRCRYPRPTTSMF
jgi:hypothetical protein